MVKYNVKVEIISSKVFCSQVKPIISAIIMLAICVFVTCSWVLSVCRLVQEFCRLRECRRRASSCSLRCSHASWDWDSRDSKASCLATTTAFWEREISYWESVHSRVEWQLHQAPCYLWCHTTLKISTVFALRLDLQLTFQRAPSQVAVLYDICVNL